MLVSGNETTLADVVKEMKDGITDNKRMIASGCEKANEAQIEKVVKEMSPTVCPPESSSKQALVSALVCEYQRLLSVKHYSTDSTLVSSFSVK